MEFLELLKHLTKAKIRYLVAGGIAVNLHGIERPTKDVDLIVYLEKNNLLKFAKLMTSLGYLPKVPVKAEDFADPKKRNDWIKNKNMIVFCFYHKKDWMNVVDVFVKHPLPFGPMYKRKEMVDVGSLKIPVIAIEDLIKLKTTAGRIQDHADIRALKQILEIRKKK